mmetsp:Transcript_25738/g.65436  ORF Transcript_25738/g.65436 Transcript_25738/m.65436 type:complete len:247 (+) Transcript_25738:30-770(+)
MGCCHSGQKVPDAGDVEFIRPQAPLPLESPNAAEAVAEQPLSTKPASPTAAMLLPSKPSPAAAEVPAEAPTPPPRRSPPPPDAPPSTVPEEAGTPTRKSKMEQRWSESVEEHRRQAANEDKEASNRAAFVEVADAGPPFREEPPTPPPRASRTSRTSSSGMGVKAKHLTTTQLKQFLREKGVEIPDGATRNILEALKREAEGDAGDDPAAEEDRRKVEAALEEARSKRESRAELKESLEAKLGSRI